MKLSVLVRKCHAWSGVLIALPVVVVIATGILLQLRKQLVFVQPPEQRGGTGDPTITWDQVMYACKATPEANVSSWADIDRIDVRPGKGMMKVRTKQNMELQVDLRTAAVLQVEYRRTELITALHEGSWFAGWAQLGLFLPAAGILFAMWCSGMYLFFQPRWVKWRRRPA